MGNAAVARLGFARAILSGWLVKLLGVVYAVLGAATFYRDNFTAADVRARWDTFALIPHWTGATWLLIALGILIVGLFEGAYRKDVDRQAEIAVRDEKMAAFLDLTPRINSLTVSDERKVGEPGEFELHVDISTKEPTAFNDDWLLDVLLPNGERLEGLQGRVPLVHSFPVGRMVLTLCFPYDQVGGIVGARAVALLKLTGTDHRGRVVSFVEGVSPVASRYRLRDPSVEKPSARTVASEPVKARAWRPARFPGMLMGGEAVVHKCSQCGYGIVQANDSGPNTVQVLPLTLKGTPVQCPKCGNADEAHF